MLGKNNIIYERFWKPFTIAVLNTDPKEASAKLLRKVIIKTLFFSNDPLRPILVKKSLNDSLIKPAVQNFLDQGGKIKCNTRLKKIVFKNNFAKEMIFNKKKIKVDNDEVIILAVTPNVASKIHLFLSIQKDRNE